MLGDGECNWYFDYLAGVEFGFEGQAVSIQVS